MLKWVVAARQLWCRVPQWRYDLGTLMKHDCKVLIYHPPKTQHSIMIPRCCSWPWMLWGSTPQESEMINTQGWFIGHNGSISNTRMVLEKCVNWLQNTCSSLSITSVIWELHQVTNHLLVAASAFLKLLDSLKYFYSQCVMLTHPSWCACSAKPVVTLSMKRSDGVSTGVKQQTVCVLNQFVSYCRFFIHKS